jgi:hypothetical protein
MMGEANGVNKKKSECSPINSADIGMERAREYQKADGRQKTKESHWPKLARGLDLLPAEESKDKSEVNSLVDWLRGQAGQTVTCDSEELIIQSSFARWRETAFEKLQASLISSSPKHRHQQAKEFATKVDYELLPEFARRIKGRYAEIVNLHHFGLEIGSIALVKGKQKDVHSKLIRAVCKWLLNVELAVDLPRRLRLYGVLDYTGVDVLQKCKSKLKPTQHIPLRHMLKACSWNLALHIQDKLGTTFLRLAGALALCQFPWNYSIGLGLLRSLVTGTALAKVLVLPVAGYCGYLAGGMLTSMLVKAGQDKVKTQKAVEDALTLLGCFKATNTAIADLLRQANVKLLSALEDPAEDRRHQLGEELKSILEMLFAKKKLVVASEQLPVEPLDGQHYLVDYFKSKEVEGGWVHVTKLDLESAAIREEHEGDIVSLSLLPPEDRKEEH